MLSRLQDVPNYTLASNEPDIRGWQVFDANCTPVGQVDSLIVDTDAEQIRYLSLDTREGSQLIAIDEIQFDERDHQIRLRPSARPMSGVAIPGQREGASTGRMGPEAGRMPLPEKPSAAARDAAPASPTAQHPHRFRLAPRHDGEGRKATLAPSIEEQVELRREHVSVSKHRIDKPLSETEFARNQGRAIETEEEIRIPVIVERMVVRKEPFVTEEVVMRKQADTVQQRVHTEEFMASEPAQRERPPEHGPGLKDMLRRRLRGW